MLSLSECNVPAIDSSKLTGELWKPPSPLRLHEGHDHDTKGCLWRRYQPGLEVSFLSSAGLGDLDVGKADRQRVCVHSRVCRSASTGGGQKSAVAALLRQNCDTRAKVWTR